MAQGSTHNIREYTVSELSSAVKRAIEDGFTLVRVRGELGRVTPHVNGHLYLDLKDAESCIAGVVWKTIAQRLKIEPAQGMEVIATGRLSTFAPQSKYQIIIDSLEPAGAGALMALLEGRRRKLAAEGLFEADRKRSIPFLPEIVGVVTSPSGAVIRDILHRLRDRFPRHVIVWPTPVQGKGAEFSIAAAIDGFNALGECGAVPRPDILIVARGGGSIEDLWQFNEEIVVRAAAASRIPLISAVGHETDTTLIDFAADLRAPTPSAAAEMAVPKRSELVAEILNKHRRLISAEGRRLEERRLRVLSAARGLGRPADRTGALGQSLDLLSSRLAAALRSRSAVGATKFTRTDARFSGRLATNFLDRKIALVAAGASRMNFAGLRRRATECGESLSRDGERLARVGNRLLRRKLERLRAAGGLLQSLSHQDVLERGFALVRSDGGALARRAADLPSRGALTLIFADGERRAFLGNAPKRRAAPPRPGQKTLFD